MSIFYQITINQWIIFYKGFFSFFPFFFFFLKHTVILGGNDDFSHSEMSRTVLPCFRGGYNLALPLIFIINGILFIYHLDNHPHIHTGCIKQNKS